MLRLILLLGLAFNTSVLANSIDNDLKSLELDKGSAKFELSWVFYWERFIDAGSSWQEPDIYLDRLQLWTKLELNDKPLPNKGFATYLTRFHGLEPAEDGYLLEFTKIRSAAKIEIVNLNDPSERYSASIGNISQDQPEASSKDLHLHFYPKKGARYELSLKVANSAIARAGAYATPIIGSAKSVNQNLQRKQLASIASMGINVAVGLYSLLIYMRRKEDMASLTLFIFCIAVTMRSMGTSVLMAELLDDAYYSLLRKLEYAAMPHGAKWNILLKSGVFPK